MPIQCMHFLKASLTHICTHTSNTFHDSAHLRDELHPQRFSISQQICRHPFWNAAKFSHRKIYLPHEGDEFTLYTAKIAEMIRQYCHLNLNDSRKAIIGWKNSWQWLYHSSLGYKNWFQWIPLKADIKQSLNKKQLLRADFNIMLIWM